MKKSTINLRELKKLIENKQNALDKIDLLNEEAKKISKQMKEIYSDDENFDPEDFFRSEDNSAWDTAKTDIEKEYGKDEYVPLGDMEDAGKFVRDLTKASDVEAAELAPEYLYEDDEDLSSAFTYHINLDERGEFYADVRNSVGDTVYEIKGGDIFEDGFMKHKNDLDGLKDYLVTLGIMDGDDELVKEV